ncbi:MAG: EscU/YscU/HrcU family type III secretion system export apparatus switch protein [Deltaproteobacteria bacterium]|nr:EscU/YscU/HrcU family type III secretion system export apparatus switch protein [Myxococcales bacterium]MDP3213967.1 EscU/YscU/HrcU family type III secretion system export apparatus switch protein [Deltaproteobacteria bacterium]
MSEADQGEREFDPTPQRREQFRKDGRYARARDAGGVAASVAVLAVLLGSRPIMARAAGLLFAGCHGDLGALDRVGVSRTLALVGGLMLSLAGPAVLAAAAAAAAVGFAQTGMEVSADHLGFKLERLNPIEGVKRLFSFKQGATEVALGLLRVGVVGWVAWRALERDLPSLVGLARLPADAAMARGAEVIVRVVLHALLALALVAAVDYGWSWWKLERDMKMTRREMMDENRSQEGDPKAKGRMKARARALARKRSLANVKQADVVVTNPTHVAVALRYAAGDAAPVVVAKGHDALALQIRSEARRHGVPILENRKLARALDAEVQIGQMVPGKHFAAVARVLAWVYRVRPSARRVRSARP